MKICIKFVLIADFARFSQSQFFCVQCTIIISWFGSLNWQRSYVF